MSGGKPFNLQNKISESEIALDILTHFFPLSFLFIYHTLMKNVTPELIKGNISISAIVSSSILFLSLSCLICSFTFFGLCGIEAVIIPLKCIFVIRKENVFTRACLFGTIDKSKKL